MLIFLSGKNTLQTHGIDKFLGSADWRVKKREHKKIGNRKNEQPSPSWSLVIIFILLSVPLPAPPVRLRNANDQLGTISPVAAFFFSNLLMCARRCTGVQEVYI